MTAAGDLSGELVAQLKMAGVPAPVLEYRFAPPRRFRFDLAWPDHLLAAEVDGATWTGGRHSRGAGIHRDCEKFSLAAADGWRVMRFDREMVRDGSALQFLEQGLGRYVASLTKEGGDG